MSLFYVRLNQGIGVYLQNDFTTFVNYIEENDFLIMIDEGNVRKQACVAFTKFGLVQFSHYFIRTGAICASLK